MRRGSANFLASLQAQSAGAVMSQHSDETIANFQAITGVDDVIQCVEILNHHHWDLVSILKK